MISREIINIEYQLEVEKYISEARHFQKGEYRYTDVWDMEPCYEYIRRKSKKKILNIMVMKNGPICFPEWDFYMYMR